MNEPALNEDVKTDLAALRAAGQAREWSAAQLTLVQLIRELPFFAAVTAVLPGLTAMLPVFRGYYADDDPRRALPEQLLSGIVSFGFAPERLPDEAIGDYEAPGMAQFVYAVLELARAAQKDRDSQERIELLGSAAANQIVAELSHDFYARHPEYHARVRDNHIDPDTGDYTDPDAAKIPLMLWMDAQVAALDAKLWDALADRLEEAFMSV
jgi:hypothetical protein